MVGTKHLPSTEQRMGRIDRAALIWAAGTLVLLYHSPTAQAQTFDEDYVVAEGVDGALNPGQIHLAGDC